MIGNDVCDSSCNNAKCYYDAGDCPSKKTPTGQCTAQMLDNKTCDLACESIDSDNWSCVRATQPCAPECGLELLTNDKCDEACNTDACRLDFNDCYDEDTECSYKLLTNDSCDTQCAGDYFLADNFACVRSN